MFEHRSEPLLTPAQFLRRLMRHAGISAVLVAGSLAIGICGYHFTEGLAWIDALENSAMLLGGMGPVNPIQSTLGKLFASFYALYAGLVFLIAAGVVFAPVFHRFIHKFHLELEEEEPGV